MVLIVAGGKARPTTADSMDMPADVGGVLSFFDGNEYAIYRILFEYVPGFDLFRRPGDGAYFFNFYAALLVGVANAPGSGKPLAMPLRILPAMAFLAALVWVFPTLMTAAESAQKTENLWQVVRSFAERAAIATAILLLLARIGKAPRSVLLPAFAVLYTAVDLTVIRLGPVFAQPDDTTDMVPLYRDLPNWQDVDTPLKATLQFLEQHGVRGPGAPYRMEALGRSLASMTALTFRINNTRGDFPLILRNYAKLFGWEEIANQPKEFNSVAPNYGAEPYRRLGLRYVLLDRWLMDHEEDNFAELMKIRAQLTSASWAERLEVPGEYEVWELRGIRQRVELLTDDGSSAGTCRITKYTNIDVTMRCKAITPGTLIFNDAMAPGWSACVANQEVAITTFLGFFRSVTVPAGKFVARMHYQPLPWFRGKVTCELPKIPPDKAGSASSP